jgi:phenylalanyl-tRNA synthetase beta subunit
VERLLGIKLSIKQITEILNSLEFKVSGKNILKINVPSHRMDVNIPADLVEEIVRVFGYENLPATLLDDELPPQHSNQKLEGTERIRDILVNSGMDEIITYSMMDPMDEARLSLEDDIDIEKFVPLKNPLSQERSHLRRSLLPGALHTARSNLRFLDKVVTFERAVCKAPGKSERRRWLLSWESGFFNGTNFSISISSSRLNRASSIGSIMEYVIISSMPEFTRISRIRSVPSSFWLLCCGGSSSSSRVAGRFS